MSTDNLALADRIGHGHVRQPDGTRCYRCADDWPCDHAEAARALRESEQREADLLRDISGYQGAWRIVRAELGLTEESPDGGLDAREALRKVSNAQAEGFRRGVEAGRQAADAVIRKLRQSVRTGDVLDVALMAAQDAIHALLPPPTGAATLEKTVAEMSRAVDASYENVDRSLRVTGAATETHEFVESQDWLRMHGKSLCAQCGEPNSHPSHGGR